MADNPNCICTNGTGIVLYSGPFELKEEFKTDLGFFGPKFKYKTILIGIPNPPELTLHGYIDIEQFKKISIFYSKNWIRHMVVDMCVLTKYEIIRSHSKPMLEKYTYVLRIIHNLETKF